MTNNNTKKWFQSTTIKGGIIAFLLMGVSIFRLDLDEGIITELVTGVFGLASVIGVIIGRLKAKQVLTK